VFYGPGPMTVGWLGAKKQIVVPTGRWVLLGAEDGFSKHTTPIPMTWLVLARLEPGAVRSFLVAHFNSKSGNARSTWSDATACEDAPGTAPFAWHGTESRVTQCVTSAVRTAASTARLFSNAFWKQPAQVLQTGGGTLPTSGFLLTEMYYTGDLSNYLKVSRLDFGLARDASAPKAGTADQTALAAVSVAERKRWAEAYSPLAALGYRKNLAEEELYAGTRPTTASASLPD
jgi:hypothetical protein